jgi:hypothetical protein
VIGHDPVAVRIDLRGIGLHIKPSYSKNGDNSKSARIRKNISHVASASMSAKPDESKSSGSCIFIPFDCIDKRIVTSLFSRLYINLSIHGLPISGAIPYAALSESDKVRTDKPARMSRNHIRLYHFSDFVANNY